MRRGDDGAVVAAARGAGATAAEERKERTKEDAAKAATAVPGEGVADSSSRGASMSKRTTPRHPQQREAHRR